MLATMATDLNRSRRSLLLSVLQPGIGRITAPNSVRVVTTSAVAPSSFSGEHLASLMTKSVALIQLSVPVMTTRPQPETSRHASHRSRLF